MDADVLRIERDGACETVSLNRPGQLNTLDEPLAAALRDYFSGLCDREDVRVIVLRGEGRAFCAGLDLSGWQNDGSRGDLQHAWRLQKGIGDIIRLMRQCPQPVIGLGHGAACGAGFSLMLACDVRLAAPDLRMNAAYLNVGLGGCDVGSSYFLPRMIGASAASEYLLTGRFIDAEMALRLGLASRIVAREELAAAARSLADEMCANAPMGLRLTKAALNLNLDARGLDEAMALEDRQQAMMLLSEDFAEGVGAFREKRQPAYRNR